jgi:hypothetical protein
LRPSPAVGFGFESLPTRLLSQLKQELLEHRRRIGDQEDMSSLRNAGLVRQWLTVLPTITAWFFLSNHCALGAVALPMETGVEVSACPMHSAPGKKNPAEKIPCCKELRAILGKTAAQSSVAAPGFVGTREFPARFFVPPPRLPQEVAELDTGPPPSLSFAESVLQESVLSHAPPLS